MVPITTDLPKKGIILPPYSNLWGKSEKERDGKVPVSQILIRPWQNAPEASAG
jgi:hypothetical protein